MRRHDYAFPFRIDATSGQAAQVSYEAHVDQMIRQVLLTSPGERADLPEFGCGLRQMLFAPHSEALDATAQVLVLQSLQRWLAGQIQVQQVVITPAGEGDDAQVLIRIDYLLLETMAQKQTEVLVI